MTASSGSSSTPKLGGLMSGFDTQNIIDQLLAVERQEIEALKETQEINQAKIDTWKDVAEQLKSLAESVQQLRAGGTIGFTLFDDKKVSSTTATVATASATSSAIVAEHSITVTTLARAHVAYGAQKASGYTLPASGSIIMNGTTINLTAGDTLEDIAASISNASYLTGEELTATVIDNRLVVQTANMGASSEIYGTSNAGSKPFDNEVDDPDDILEVELGFITSAGDLENVSQTSADSSFTVDGIPITRTSNTISDVIEGVTFSMLTTGSTTLKINYNTDEIKETITEFVDLYNETRDFINRTRNAKLNEDDEFGLFFSDSLLRELFNDVRSLTTSGIKMGGSDWDGTVQLSAAGTAGDKTLSLNGFSNPTGTLSAGDSFTIGSDSTIYTVLNDAAIAGNAATVDIQPPLAADTASGTSVRVVIRTLEDIGVGVRTDTVSGVEGVLGILDEDALESMLATNVPLIKLLFTRNDTNEDSQGVARRLYSWIDQQTKISVYEATTRSIDDVKIPGIEEINTRIDDQITRLEERLAKREEMLIKQFSEMENALARAQSAGAAIAGLSGQQQSQ